MSIPGLGLGGAPASSDPQEAFRARITVTKAGIRRYANWFDWIAALSIINSLISLFDGKLHFVVGLGITEVIDELAQKGGSSQGQVVGFVATVAVAGFFWLMGRFAKNGQYWALIVGMVLYALDGGLLLLGQAWLSVAFHGYVLFLLSKTFGAIKQFEAAKRDAEAHGVFLGTTT